MSTLDYAFDPNASYEPEGPSQAQLNFHKRLVAEIRKAIAAQQAALPDDLRSADQLRAAQQLQERFNELAQEPQSKGLASLAIQELKCMNFEQQSQQIATKLGIPAPTPLDPAIPLRQRVYDAELAYDELELVSMSRNFQVPLPPFSGPPSAGQRRAYVDHHMPSLQLQKLQNATGDRSFQLRPDLPAQSEEELAADSAALENAATPEERNAIFAEFEARDEATRSSLAPTTEQINEEVARLRQLPSRQQLRAIKEYSKETGESLEQPKTAAEARKTMDYVKKGYETFKVREQQAQAQIGDRSGPVPDEAPELLGPSTYSPAIQDGELERVQEPYANAFDERPELSAREELAREVGNIDLPFEATAAALKKTDSLSALGNKAEQIGAAARAAGVENLSYDAGGTVQFASVDEALATISAIHRSRANAHSRSTPEPTQGGRWVDNSESEQRGPSDPQMNKLQELADQLNLEIVEPSKSSYSTTPIEKTGFDGRIVVPESSAETSRLITELIERTEAQQSYMQVAAQVRGLDRSELASLRGVMTERESQILDLRFSEGQSREVVCKATGLSPDHLHAAETHITAKAQKHLESVAKNMKTAEKAASQHAAAKQSAANARTSPVLPAL